MEKYRTERKAQNFCVEMFSSYAEGCLVGTDGFRPPSSEILQLGVNSVICIGIKNWAEHTRYTCILIYILIFDVLHTLYAFIERQ